MRARRVILTTGLVSLTLWAFTATHVAAQGTRDASGEARTEARTRRARPVWLAADGPVLAMQAEAEPADAPADAPAEPPAPAAPKPAAPKGGGAKAPNGAKAAEGAQPGARQVQAAPGAPPARPGEVPAGAPAAKGAPGAPTLRPGEGPAPAVEANGRLTINPQSPFLGKRVDILEGEIPAVEFIRFLADYTGLPVIVESGGAQGTALTQPITIAAEIKNADAEIVKAILESNRWLVFQERLPSGKEYISVKPAQATGTSGEPPKEGEVIEVAADGELRVVKGVELEKEDLGIGEDEMATMVFTLENTPPGELLKSLNDLVGASSGGAARGAQARSRAFSAVEIPETMMLIITAKFGLLDYIRKLISILDVPAEDPARIVDIVRVEEADATELAGIIEGFLGQRTGLRTGLRRLPTTTTTTTARPGGTTRPPTSTRRSSGRLLPEDIPTVLIPDIRTNKIIVVTYNPSDLEDIYLLVRELDTRFDIRRLKTRIYRMKFLKAEEVAPVIQALVGGGGVGLSGQRGLGRNPRTRTQRGISRVSQARPTTTPTATPGATGQGGLLPTNIVAHEETNSLIIQAETEEYEEVLNILSSIDIRKRQLFLEAALVQVSTSSALNYTIELLAGDPDDEATRVLFESSFGLTGIDMENFNRIIPDLTQPPPGGLLAVMNRGKFPALVSFFKANSDSQVLATPFILADDNTPSIIDVTETRFVVTTTTVNTATTSNQQGEDAGITLDILPRITSEDSVLLDVSLIVSEFGQSATVEVLPPKVANSINAAVTIPDDEIYVIGGLTRQNKSKTVSKLPILGDIPLLGKLFRSEGTSNSQSNLYVFLRAHILSDPNFDDLKQISHQALDQVREFTEDLKPSRFDTPDVKSQVQEEKDHDAPKSFQLRPGAEGDTRSSVRYGPQESYRRRQDAYRDDPESPHRAETAPKVEPEGSLPPLMPAERPTEAAGPPPRDTKGVADPGVEPAEGSEDGAGPETPAPWRQRGFEVDPEGESWFVPLKPLESPTTKKTSQRSKRTRKASRVRLAAQ